MKTIRIHGDKGDSDILIGERLQNLKKYIPMENSVIITDTNIRKRYQHDFPSVNIIEIGIGEESKTIDTARYIYSSLLDMDADRSSFIVGIGGGIICDIAGFVASTYLRGVRFGFVSTTLLSQVDASVGGKNGVNFKGYKNIIGVFNQPGFVICDSNLLQTLPQKEILNGLAEIVKHGAIEDSNLFAYIEDHYQKALELEPEVIETLVYESIVIKSSIVNLDEREGGVRRKLNFGHTFGHAIEKTTNASHGEAVSAGMVFAAYLSVRKGLLSETVADRLVGLLKKLNLPVYLDFDKEKVIDALRKDKKREGDHLYFVLLRDIGSTVVVKTPMKELETIVDDFSSMGETYSS